MSRKSMVLAILALSTLAVSAQASNITICRVFEQGLEQLKGVEGGTGAYSCPYIPR